jgi:hypothetical protein
MNSPWPRLPTTRRSASRERGRPGWSADEPLGCRGGVGGGEDLGVRGAVLLGAPVVDGRR